MSFIYVPVKKNCIFDPDEIYTPWLNLHRKLLPQPVIYRVLQMHGYNGKNMYSQAELPPNDVQKFKVPFRTHPVSRTHMLVKQGHILCTLSQDTLCGRSEHVLHGLQRKSSLMIQVFLGCHTVHGNCNSQIRKLLQLI